MNYIFKSNLIPILVIVYELLITILRYKQIGNKDFKKAVNVLTIITLIFLPFLFLNLFECIFRYLKM